MKNSRYAWVALRAYSSVFHAWQLCKVLSCSRLYRLLGVVSYMLIFSLLTSPMPGSRVVRTGRSVTLPNVVKDNKTEFS